MLGRRCLHLARRQPQRLRVLVLSTATRRLAPDESPDATLRQVASERVTVRRLPDDAHALRTTPRGRGSRRCRRDQSDEPATIAPMMAPIVRPRRNEAVERPSSRSLMSCLSKDRGWRRPRRRRSRATPPIEAPTRWKSPIITTVEGRGGRRARRRPTPQDRREDDDRQPAAGAAPDEHEERGVEDAGEDGEDERRVEAHTPEPTSSPAAATSCAPRKRAGVRASVVSTTTGRAIRPPPRTTSPRRRGRPPARARRPRPGIGLDEPATTACRLRVGRRPDGRGDRGRAVADPDLGPERLSAGRRVAGDEARPFELDRRRLEVLAPPERDGVRQRVDPADIARLAQRDAEPWRWPTV